MSSSGRCRSRWFLVGVAALTLGLLAGPLMTRTVKASTIVVSALGVTLGLGSATGLSGQSLHIHCTSLL